MTANAIASLLASRAEEACRHLLPNGVLDGREWCVGGLDGHAGQSLKICVDGSKAGVWCDFGDVDAKGDMIGLWMRTKNVDIGQACEEAQDWLNVPPEQRNGDRQPPQPRKKREPKPPSESWLRLQERMRKGSDEELNALAELRAIPSIGGLRLASNAHTLFFGPVWDDGADHESWIITDGSRRNAQARRMDGQPWSGLSAKAKTITGCEAGWPIGAHGLNGHAAVIVEGGPDFLAAWHCISVAGKQDSVRPVAILGSSQVMPDDAVELFRGKKVWIIPHNDDNEAGANGATRWKGQAESVEATVSIVDVGAVKDLNDLVASGAELPTFSSPAQIIDDDEAPVAPPQSVGKSELIAKPLPDFRLPKKGDPTILIGNRWLSRGDIAILASTSGMGKSSLSIQAATTWALGQLLFGGFKPNGSLKSLIIQSEDSEGDIAEMWLSLQHAMKLTDEQVAIIKTMVIIVTDRIHRGISFRAELKRLIGLHHPDIIWINPLLAFIGGDVNDSTDVGLFIREQLNSLNEPPAFAYIIVHHTAKPPKERKERQWNEVMYEMAGSADLTNSARAILALQATGKEGEFRLIGAKRGARAGLIHQVPSTKNPALKFDAPTSIITICHSKDRMEVDGQDLGVIHWERGEATEEAGSKNKGGRPAKYDMQDFLKHVPVGRQEAKPPLQIWKFVKLGSGISDSGFKDLILRAAKDGTVRTEDRPNIGCVYWVE